MSSHPNQLRALIALLTTSVDTIEASYAKADVGIPSLDDPSPHPSDAVRRSTEWTHAVWTVQAACQQLVRLVTDPTEMTMAAAFEMLEPACMRVALDVKVAEHLLSHPSGLHVSELSKLTGIESGKLARVLRYLTRKHVFREVDRDVFANNRLSVQLLSPFVTPMAATAGHLTEEVYTSLSALSPTLLDPVSGPSYAPDKTAFTRAYHFDGPIFKYFEQDARMAERFGLAMMGVAESAIQAMRFGFPWSSLLQGTTLCDVGGGIGSISMGLSRYFPNLRIVLQDLPEQLDGAKKVWEEKAKDAVDQGRVEFSELDFFKQTPKEGCDIYHLKMVIHDWPDKECQTILTNVARAMTPSSRLLIHEYVLQNPLRREDASKDIIVAPEPLLPNWGEGRIQPYRADMVMMVLGNSKERTFDEFLSLGSAAGLEFVKLWDLGETSFVEFKLPSKKTE